MGLEHNEAMDGTSDWKRSEGHLWMTTLSLSPAIEQG